MNNYINESDFNKVSTGTIMKTLGQISIGIFEATKAVAAFIGSMFKMFIGKY